jgi:hypothetical protein
MTGKADFTEQEWDLILGAPPLAGMIVVMSAHGGMFKESFAIGKAYTEAREQHGASQLLDEVVGSKPKIERPHAGSFEELKQQGTGRLHDAVALLESKATPEEVADYRSFVVALADRVAHAHREDGVDVSDPERAAIDEIAAALGSAA